MNSGVSVAAEAPLRRMARRANVRAVGFNFMTTAAALEWLATFCWVNCMMPSAGQMLARVRRDTSLQRSPVLQAKRNSSFTSVLEQGVSAKSCNSLKVSGFLGWAVWLCVRTSRAGLSVSSPSRTRCPRNCRNLPK